MHPDDPAICLVHDGRDALVSWARQASEQDPATFETHVASMITRAGAIGAGGWGSNVLSCLRPAAAHRPVLTYPQLTATPEAPQTTALPALPWERSMCHARQPRRVHALAGEHAAAAFAIGRRDSSPA